jgi:hypothetical protein
VAIGLAKHAATPLRLANLSHNPPNESAYSYAGYVIPEDPAPAVWLQGPRWNFVYAYERSTGGAERRRTSNPSSRLAGDGERMGRHFVATFVEPEQPLIVVQVDRRRFPIDGQTTARAVVRLGGLLTVLRLGREGESSLDLRQYTPSRLISRLIDPAWDDLDELAMDGALGIAILVESIDAQETYIKHHDPSGRPTDVLG